MKKLHTLLTEITQLSTNIATNYPDLYQFLNENPMTIPSVSHPAINETILREYLSSLKDLLRHHLETHKVRKQR